MRSLRALVGQKKKCESSSPGTTNPTTTAAPIPFVPFKTSYTSNVVPIPDDFLKTTPPDAKPVTVKPINFTKSGLPQYEGCYAIILDNVISPSECAEMLRLAEASSVATKAATATTNEDDDNTKTATTESEAEAPSPWQPALVNVGQGYEILTPDYRNSDRIIWDCQEVVDRLWARCVAGCPELWERLAVLDGEDDPITPRRGGGRKARNKGGDDEKAPYWEFRGLNERMRFLRYGPGQFFRPHCDGAYRPESTDGKVQSTLLTFHLYLNDSKAEAEDGKANLVGGATPFLSRDETKRLDVNPKAGRVLIFQHSRLYHSGDDVIKGIKYTMRSDILYELIFPEEERDGDD